MQIGTRGLSETTAQTWWPRTQGLYPLLFIGSFPTNYPLKASSKLPGRTEFPQLRVGGSRTPGRQRYQDARDFRFFKNATSDELLREIAARLDRDPSLADRSVWRGDPKDLDRRQVTDDEIADTISKLGKPDVSLAALHGDHKLDDEGNDAA